MISSEQLEAIVERIGQDKHSKADIDTLRQLLVTGEKADLLQLGKYNINIGQGQDIQIGDRNYIEWNEDAIQSLIEVVQNQLTQVVGLPEDLPRSGVVDFLGREQELILIDQQFQNSQGKKVVSLSGMGGIGKTELALQYALRYKQNYPGGLCWLQARGSNIGNQIVQFARSRLQIDPPEGLELSEQVGFCWRYWHPGDVLIIIDDVINYRNIKPYLPPSDDRFNILITTRLKLGRSVNQISVDVLEEHAALAFLSTLVEAGFTDSEKEIAEKLCQWLGYLPLGIELVGRYLARKPDLTLEEMYQRLESKSLASPAFKNSNTDMTHELSLVPTKFVWIS